MKQKPTIRSQKQNWSFIPNEVAQDVNPVFREWNVKHGFLKNAEGVEDRGFWQADSLEVDINGNSKYIVSKHWQISSVSKKVNKVWENEKAYYMAEGVKRLGKELEWLQTRKELMLNPYYQEEPTPAVVLVNYMKRKLR